MNFSALFIPVLGGYAFLVGAWITRYSTTRRSGYHLFFNSALVGTSLLCLARVITKAFESSFSPFQAWWQSVANFPYSGTLAMTLLLAIAAPLLINGALLLFSNKARWAMKAAEKHGNLIDWLIEQALGTGSLLEITTKSGKSYVGFPQSSDLSSGDSFEVALIPVLSGYRQAETRKLEFTTDYWEAYFESAKEGSSLSHLSPDEFLLVIPRREIISARQFDPDAYNFFNRIPGEGQTDQ